MLRSVHATKNIFDTANYETKVCGWNASPITHRLRLWASDLRLLHDHRKLQRTVPDDKETSEDQPGPFAEIGGRVSRPAGYACSNQKGDQKPRENVHRPYGGRDEG